MNNKVLLFRATVVHSNKVLLFRTTENVRGYASVTHRITKRTPKKYS